MSVKAKVTRYQHPLDLFQPGLTNDDDAVVNDVDQLLIKMIFTVMIMMSDVDANYCDDNDDGG